MSRIHWLKRRDFLKHASGLVASGAAASFVPQLSLMGTALAQGMATGYKALVCIYLDGGNDSWNLLIPADNSTSVPVSGRTPLTGFQATPYGWYATSRGGHFDGDASRLGIPLVGSIAGTNLPNALPLNPAGQYALNPAAPELQALFNAGRLSFIANVGPLVQPLRKSNFNSYPRPPQLYSHNDQTNLWQIGGGSSSSNPNGWGGQLAGRAVGLPPASGLSPCISIAGQTRFLVGTYPGSQPVFPYRLSTSASTPATALTNYNSGDPAGSKRREILQSLLDMTYPQTFSNEYGDIVDRSLGLSATVNAAVASLSASGSPFAAFNTAVSNIPNSNLGNQLRQVARMIAASRFGQGSIQANRQVFFVRTGGYDTHDGQVPAASPAANGVWAGHLGLLQQVSQAMNAFNNALTALNAVAGFSGIVNEVLTFTMSEFARTLNSNGNGTDHAWGGVQMVMGAPTTQGGPLLGGQVFGRYPLQLLGRTYPDSAPDSLGECFNRGEFIPTTAVEQMSATLARWMGVSDLDLTAVFPNIDVVSNAAHPNAGVLAYPGQRLVPFLNLS